MEAKMFTYTIPFFILREEVMNDPAYSNDEYMEYLKNFDRVEFQSPKEIKSLLIELTIPSKHRICNVYCYDKEIEGFPDDKTPNPVGRLQLTLWTDYGLGPEIITYF